MGPLWCWVILFLYRSSFAQVLPPLPELPSPSPLGSPSPLPSALNDIVNPSPSPLLPTAIPPGVAPPLSPLPSVAPTPPIGSGVPQASTAPGLSQTPSPSPSPGWEFINQDGDCVRDETRPRPVLGKSQLRYAVAVLLSAAAVALASVLYGLASDWEPEIDHSGYRLLFIILARLFIIGAVKVSAALVASITKASPDDGALDASGAFLTWGTAIFTRLYYEGLKMTMAALGFTSNKAIWDDELKDFFSVEPALPRVVSESEPENEELYNRAEKGGVETFKAKASLFRRIFGGSNERRLLVVTSVLYFASEISSLTTNVLSLVGAFVENADHTIFFSSESEGGQCPITSKDIPILGGVITVQAIYAVTQQPSLVPLLTVSAFCPDCQRYPTVNKLLKKLKWISCVILLIWVGSILTLPLFSKPLEPFFLSGDISLFWYVIIAPPDYSSPSYIITASYTCLAAVVGIIIIKGISRSQRRDGEGHEEVAKS